MSASVSRTVRAAALLLCLVFCLLSLPACKQKNDPLAPLGFSSLRIDADGKRVTASLRLDAITLQEHAGEWVYLYELLPGETTETAKGIKAIASEKISSSVQFAFDLFDGDRSRLYSSFVVGFQDGSVLSHDGHAIENPNRLASGKAPVLRTSSPKGLLVDDVQNAADLQTSHAAFELSLAELLGNTPDPSSLALSSYDFGGVTYLYNESALSTLDSKIAAATESGMQVSLRLLLDTAIDQKTAAALLSLIADRYDGDHGVLSAILLHPETLTVAELSDPASISHLAALCRLADLALRSHVSNGRVYVHSDFPMTDTRTLFTALQSAISVGGSFAWGMSVLAETPLPTVEAGDDAITSENLGALSDLLSSSTRAGASWLSVDLVPIDAQAADVQAASYAYHYLTAAAAKPTMIFYSAHVDDPDGDAEWGLYSSDGQARRLASVYSAIDSGLSEADILLCRELWGAEDRWSDSLASTISSKLVSGNAGIGVGGIGESVLFDFRNADALGFTAISSVSGLSHRESAAQDAEVLFLWANPLNPDRSASMRDASGIQKLLPSGASLEDALSLSVHFLAQTAVAESTVARLRLVGSAPNGSRLVYESETEVDCGSWQTATFQISQFVLYADLSAPVLLSLTVDNPDTETEPYPLWVSRVLVRAPESQTLDLAPLLLILGGVAVGCVGVLLLYRASVARAEQKRRRRTRAAGKRGMRKG